MNSDPSYLRKIALDLVDTLVQNGDDVSVAKSIVSRFSQGELLMLNEIYGRDVELLAEDIVTGDRLLLDSNGHIHSIVLPRDISDSILENLHLLKYLNTILLEYSSLSMDGQYVMNRLRTLGNMPSLKEVYFYSDRYVDLPTLANLDSDIVMNRPRSLSIRDDLKMYNIRPSTDL